MDIQQLVKDDVAINAEMLKFDEKIYWLSSLCDGLRDSVRDLLELSHKDDSAISGRLATELTERYHRLRAETAALLADQDGAAERFLSWTRTLPEAANGGELYEAAGNMARAIDTLLQAPIFVTTRASQRGDIKSMLTKLGLTATPDKGTETGAGQYL